MWLCDGETRNESVDDQLGLVGIEEVEHIVELHLQPHLCFSLVFALIFGQSHFSIYDFDCVLGDVDMVLVSQFLGLLQVGWDVLVQVSDCREPCSWRPQHGFPDFAIELAGSNYQLRLFKDMLNFLQNLRVLVFQSWKHAKHESWQRQDKLLLHVKDVVLDQVEEALLHLESSKLVEVEQSTEKERNA